MRISAKALEIADGKISGINVSGTTVTVTDKNILSALTETKSATLSNTSFSFAIGGDVPTSATDKSAVWSAVENNSATYTSAHQTDFYTATAQNIFYTGEKNKSTFTVEGLNENLTTITDNEISVAEKIVTVKKSAFKTTDGETLKFSGNGYTFKLDDALKSSASVSGENFNAGTYTAKSWSEYFSQATEANSTTYTYHSATGGEELFKIDGLTVAPENPVKQANEYEIKLLTGTDVTISESQTDVLNNSTIDAQNVTNLTANFSATVTTKSATVNGISYTAADNGTLTIATTTTTSTLTSGTIIVTGEQLGVKVTGDSNGVKVNVTNGVVDSITDLNSSGTVEFGGKTYTRTGDFISDGTNHYAATDTTNLLALGAATNYVEVTDTIDLQNVTTKTVFGVDGKQVAVYDSGALTIDSGSYKVLTSGVVTIGGTTYNATTALEFQATKDNSTLTNGTVNGIQTLTTTSNKNFSVNNDTDGVTVTVANSEVTAVTNLADGGTVTYDGKTFLHTLTTAATVTLSEGDELSVNGAPRYTSGTKLTVSDFGTGKEISFGNTITELTKSGENIIAKSNGVDALTIGGLTFSTSSNGWTAVDNGSAIYSEKFSGGAEISATKIVYRADSTNEIFKLENLNSTATLEQVKAAVSVDGYEITFTAETVLDQNKIISAPDNYTFKLGGNVTQSETKGLSWETINAANGEYKYIAAGDTAGYKISNNKISYVTDTRDTFTITGVKSTDGISVNNKTVTVPSTALDNKTVTVSAGYNLVLSGVTEPEEISAGWATSGNDFVYQTAYVKTAGYKSDGTYISATTPTELFTLSNSSATLNGLNLSGVSVTNDAGKYTVELSAAALPTGTFADGMTITLTQKNNTDCTLKLATGIDKTQTQKSAATLVNGTYTSETFKAWYDDSTANQIACHPETTAKIFTVTNLNSNAALGTNVIVTDGDTTNFKFKAAALDKKSVTISGENFSVELDTDVDTTAETINETMKFLGNTMTYLASGVGEYYEKTESGVTYHEATGSELFKIEGLSAEPGNPVKQASGGYEIKSLTGTDVTISETQKDVLNNSTIDAQNVTNLTANFSATVTTKSATVNGISYTAADNGTLTIATTAETSTLTSGKVTVTPENPLPLTGGNKISVSSGSIKISVENGTTLTVENFTGGEISFDDTITELTKSGGNIIAKSNGVDALTIGGLNSPSSSNGWSVRGDSATYSQNFTGGAEISATKIIYRAGSTNKNFTLNNLKDNVTLAEVRSAINLSGKNIIFKSDSILDKNKIVSAPAGYTLKLGNDVQRVEKISSGWNGNIYTAEGFTAGYSIDGGKIIYSEQIGGEQFSVDGATDKSGIKIDGKSVTIGDSSLNKNSVTFTNIDGADFIFALDDDVQRVEKISSGWNGNIYTAEGFTAGYSIDGGKIIYSEQIGGEQFSVDGATDKSGIKIDGKSVTIGDSSLNKNSVTFTNLNDADFNFALDDDVQRVEKISAGWNGNIYTAEGFTAGYSIDDGKIIYSEQIGGEQFSVDGITDKSGIKIDGKTVTIGDSSLNKNSVTFTNLNDADFNFALDNDVARVEKISAGWSGNIFTAEGFTAGYLIDDGKIIYSKQIGGEQFSVDGITDKSGIDVDGKSVTIGDSSLNKNSVTFTNLNGADFNFALNDDVQRVEKISSGWNGNIYTAEGFTAGYSIDGGKIIYSEQIGGEQFTISGIKSTDGVTVDGKNVFVNSDALDGKNVTLATEDGYEIFLGEDVVARVKKISSGWNGNTYTAEGFTAGYSIDDGKIIYSEQIGGEQFSVDGATDKSGIKIDGKSVTIGDSSLNKNSVTFTNLNDADFNFALDDDVQRVEKILSGWNGNIYTAEGFTAGYSIDDGKIIYSEQIGGEQFSVDGITDKSGIKIDGKTVTIGDSSLNKNSVTFTNIDGADFIFALDDDVQRVEKISSGWNGNIYTAEGFTAGYSIDGGKIIYSEQIGGEQFTISGIKSTDGVTVDGKNVFVNSDALDGKNVTLATEDGYEIFLGDDVVARVEKISAGWNDNIYTTEGFTAGYSIDDGKIIYSEQIGGESFSVDGATDKSGIEIDGKNVTIGEPSLNKNSVTFTNLNDADFNFALDDDVQRVEKISSGWSGNIYTAQGFTAGYSIDGGKIIYSEQIGGEQFSVDGITDKSGIKIDGKSVTIGEPSLNKNSVTFTNLNGADFIFALDDDVARVEKISSGWSGNIYTAQGFTAGYSIDDGKIIYSEQIGGEQFSVDGITDKSGIKIDGKTVTIGDSSLNKNPVTFTTDDNYELKLGDDVQRVEKISAGWNGNIYTAEGFTAGYSIDDGKIIYSEQIGGEQFSVDGITDKSGIDVDGKSVTIGEPSLNKNSVTFTNLNGADFIFALDDDVARVEKISSGWNGNIYTAQGFTAGYSIDGGKIIYSEQIGGEQFSVDGITDKSGIKIDGKTVTIGDSSLNKNSVTFTNIDGADFIFALDDDVQRVEKISSGWSGNIYTAEGFSAGYSIDDGKIIYSDQIGGEQFSVDGITDKSGIKIDGKNVTIGDSSLNKNSVTFTNLNGADFNFALNDDVQRVEKISSGWSGNIYTAEGFTAGYSIDDGKITYSGQIGGEQFSVDGVTDKSGIKIDDKSVTIGNSSLNKNSVTFTNLNDADFNFALNDNVQRVEKISSGWSGNIYTAEGFTAGYSIDDGKITYSGQIGGEQFSVDGITDKSGIKIDGKTVTIGNSSLNKNSVTFTNIDGADFIFALGDDVARVEKISSGWNGNTYTAEGFTAGYSIDDGKIIYSDQIGGEQFSVDGADNKSGIKIDGKTVTIGNSSLNKNSVTFTNLNDADFNFALNDDVQRVEKISSGWNGNIYTAEGFTAGYLIDDGKIIYSEQIGGEQFSVDGVTDKSGIKIDGKSVTIGDSSLNKNPVTFKNIDGADFIFALGDDVARVEKISSGWNGNIYTAEGFTAGYLIDDGKIIYSEQIGGESFTISGIKSTDDVIVDGKKITVNRNNIISGQKVAITPADIYTLELVGEISNEDDNSDEYDESDRTDPARLIREITGIDIHKLDKIDGNHDDFDEIISEKIVQLNFSEGDGVQEINLSNSEYPQVVSLEGGKQNLDFDFDDINIAVVDKTADDRKAIEFSNNRSLGIFRSADAKTNVTLGTGSDSLFVDRNARVRVDMSNGGNAKIVPYSGTVTLENYDAATGSVIVVPYVENIVDAVKNNSIKLVGNVMRLGSGDSKAAVKFNDKDENSTLVNLITESGAVQKVGFTGNFGGTLDTTELQGDFLLKGNYAETSSAKQKRKGSTITAGEGDDTLLAGARDVIDGGDGNNQIYLTPPELRQNKSGATIILGGKGRNTVYGFGGGLAYDDDCVKVDNFSDIDFKFDSDGLLLTSGDARLKFDGGSVETSEKILITDGSSTLRAVIAKPEQTVTITNDNDGLPNAFFGKNSGLDFSEFNGNVNINLAEGSGFLNGRAAIFDGINELQAGDGFCTLIGSENSETLTAGNGYGTIGGGKGNDKIIGKGGSPDKNGRTEFLFGAGDGRDTISGFEFLTPENRFAGIDDRIEIGNSDINNAYCSGNDVVIEFDDNSELLVEGAVGKDFRIADMIAKVDKNIAFDGIANCYVADGGTELVVDSSVGAAEIWLDNSHGTKFYGNIFTLDASAVAGNTSLVGNQFDNTIIAGQGDSSLWGGYGNDLLIGGSSRNTFFYLFGNGNDTIQGAGDGDEIILADIFREQIAEIYTDADFVAVRFTDGGSLQINGNTEINCVLADGSKLAYRD